MPMRKYIIFIVVAVCLLVLVPGLVSCQSDKERPLSETDPALVQESGGTKELPDETDETNTESETTDETGEETGTETGKETDETFEVIFQNPDGSEIWRATFQKGREVLYEGPEPVYRDGKQAYRFTGWDIELSLIVSDAVVTAGYEKEKEIPTETETETETGLVADDGIDWGDIHWI